MLLEGRVVIVTGGARGIGRDVCRVLARQGARVVVNYSASKERAEAVVAEIAAEGGMATAFGADVRELSGYEALVAHAREAHGGLDAVVNNAIAGKQDGAFEEATDADFEAAFDFGAGRWRTRFGRRCPPSPSAAGGGS